MRKSIALLLLATTLLLPCKNTFASEAYIDTALQNEYETSMQVSCRQYSHYSVSVPIELPEGNEGHVSVTDASFENGFHLDMFVSNLNEENKIVLANSDGDEITATVNVDNAVVSRDFPACTFTGNGIHTISYNKDWTANAKAGIYDGTICFKFVLSTD